MDEREIYEYDHLDAFLAIDDLEAGIGFFIGRREDCVSIIIPRDEARMLWVCLGNALGLTLADAVVSK